MSIRINGLKCILHVYPNILLKQSTQNTGWNILEKLFHFFLLLNKQFVIDKIK